MALLISDEEAKRRLEHEANLLVKHKIITPHHDRNGGRPANGKNIPIEIKAVLGTLAKLDTGKNVSDTFNVPECQVNAYKNGLSSDKRKPDPKLRELNEKRLETIHDKVVDRILKSLSEITDEKVEESSYVALTKGATNLAGVLDKLREPGNSSTVNQQFVFFGVKPRTEENYNVIEVEASVNQ